MPFFEKRAHFDIVIPGTVHLAKFQLCLKTNGKKYRRITQTIHSFLYSFWLTNTICVRIILLIVFYY